MRTPTTYTWKFFVDRNARKKPVLFFFYGAPDSSTAPPTAGTRM
ncbi:hypothetical protein [Streptomyces sp. NPDC052042]